VSGRLDGQSAIVTGAGRGIGRGIARVYAREGAAVLCVDRDEETATRTAAELTAAGARGEAVRAELTDEGDVEAAVAAAVERFGRIDVLTHNAGIYPSATLAELDRAGWDHVQAVNVTSLFLLVKAVLPQMKAQGGGRITVTSSITGNRTAIPALTHYATSKAALNGFIRSAALELAPYRIAVNGVEPGTVLTEGVQQLMNQAEIDEVAKGVPLRRLADPEDIAHAHLFLASSEASYITGQTIVVDGGQILPESVEATFYEG
jgi:3-oxoacyl-[acyl-carrier protein] reductase